MLQRRRRERRRSRAVSVAAAVLTLLIGCAGIALAQWVLSTPEDRTAHLLEVGEAYTVPARPPFVGDLVVYGTPPNGVRPELEEVDCEVTAGGGQLSTDAAAREDRVVVDDRGLVPLVSFPGREGHSIVCAGTAMEAAAPLYVVPGGNSRSLIPMAAYSVAALLIPLGLVWLMMIRSAVR